MLKSVFSRSGFTQGHFNNELGKEMFGTRQKEDVVAAKDVLKQLSHLYDNENPLVPINLKLKCRAGEPVELTAESFDRKAVAVGEIPEKAIHKPMTKETLHDRISKLGGTPFYAEDIEIQLDDGLIVSAANINALRREAVQKLLDAETQQAVEVLPFKAIQPGLKSAEPYFTARFSCADQIPDRHVFKRIFIPIWSSVEDFVDNRAGVELPRGLFGMEEQLEKRLITLKKAGIKNALCGNIGSYRLAQRLGFQVFGDFGLNVFNSEAARQVHSPILSFELTVDEANQINAADTGIVAYGRLPLMLTRNCPVKSNIGCERCRKNGSLTDRKGITFPVVCSPYPCVEILNSVPLYMADRMKEIKTDFIHFYFTDESRNDVEKIAALYEARGKADFEYTRGLYYRGVL